MNDSTFLINREHRVAKIQKLCGTDGLCHFSDIVLNNSSDDRKDLKTSTVGAIPCGCPMNNLLTKENKTGWKEAYFLTEALSPSPTPHKKKKGGSRRKGSAN